MGKINFDTVITDMISKIPNKEIDLLKALNLNLSDSCKNIEETIKWGRAYETLEKHIPNPVEDWEFNVICIFGIGLFKDN